MHVWWQDDKPGFTFKLKAGHAYYQDEYGSRRADLIGAYRLDSANSAKQRVLVLFSVFSAYGSSSQNHYAQVFEWKYRVLKVAQEIEWDTHVQIGNQDYVVFNSEKRDLTIRVARYLDFDARCCVSAVDVIRFQWDGSKLIQKSKRTELSEYGKREGKKLP